MNSFPFEVQCVIFEQMIGSSLNLDSSININCSLESLFTYCSVCKHWNQLFSPILQHIAQDPIGWSLKHEKTHLFEKWLKAADAWVKKDKRCLSECIQYFVEKYTFNNKIAPITQAEKFSFSIFSALGHHRVSENFIKFVWLSFHQNKFFQTALSDYHQSLVYTEDKFNIKQSARFHITNTPCRLREMLLKNNTAANVRYHVERYMLSKN